MFMDNFEKVVYTKMKRVEVDVTCLIRKSVTFLCLCANMLLGTCKAVKGLAPYNLNSKQDVGLLTKGQIYNLYLKT